MMMICWVLIRPQSWLSEADSKKLKSTLPTAASLVAFPTAAAAASESSSFSGFCGGI
jgi:hypothetical protein